eukprot:3290267-Pleurochrysis_carterae.AAC.2
MAAHAATPYSSSPWSPATAATLSSSTGSRASRASAAIAASGDATSTASISRQRSVGDDPLAGSSFTVEPAGRSRSVCHCAAYAPPLAVARHSAARLAVASSAYQQHALRRLRSAGRPAVSARPPGRRRTARLAQQPCPIRPRKPLLHPRPGSKRRSQPARRPCPARPFRAPPSPPDAAAPSLRPAAGARRPSSPPVRGRGAARRPRDRGEALGAGRPPLRWRAPPDSRGARRRRLPGGAAAEVQQAPRPTAAAAPSLRALSLL